MIEARSGESSSVRRILIHEDYYNNRRNNVALIFLDKSLTWSQVLTVKQSVCLVVSRAKTALAAGWHFSSVNTCCRSLFGPSTPVNGLNIMPLDRSR